jgi:CheY-like chemotaxis protein
VLLPVSRHDGSVGSSPTRAAGPETSYRVLVVDDEAEIADLLREILELAGHEVDVADSGESALQRVADVRYDFVLSDMRMPGMDGTMLYEALCKRDPDLAERLAFITGDTLSPNAAGFLQRTGLRHLPKPFEPRQVTDLIVQLGAGRRRNHPPRRR